MRTYVYARDTAGCGEFLKRREEGELYVFPCSTRTLIIHDGRKATSRAADALCSYILHIVQPEALRGFLRGMLPGFSPKLIRSLTVAAVRELYPSPEHFALARREIFGRIRQLLLSGKPFSVEGFLTFGLRGRLEQMRRAAAAVLSRREEEGRLYDGELAIRAYRDFLPSSGATAYLLAAEGRVRMTDAEGRALQTESWRPPEWFSCDTSGTDALLLCLAAFHPQRIVLRGGAEAVAETARRIAPVFGDILIVM